MAPCTHHQLLTTFSALILGFRMVSVSPIQRQWWFQAVSGYFGRFQGVSGSAVNGHGSVSIAHSGATALRIPRRPHSHVGVLLLTMRGFRGTVGCWRVSRPLRTAELPGGFRRLHRRLLLRPHPLLPARPHHPPNQGRGRDGAFGQQQPLKGVP